MWFVRLYSIKLILELFVEVAALTMLMSLDTWTNESEYVTNATELNKLMRSVLIISTRILFGLHTLVGKTDF